MDRIKKQDLPVAEIWAGTVQFRWFVDRKPGAVRKLQQLWQRTDEQANGEEEWRIVPTGFAPETLALE